MYTEEFWKKIDEIDKKLEDPNSTIRDIHYYQDLSLAYKIQLNSCY